MQPRATATSDELSLAELSLAELSLARLLRRSRSHEIERTLTIGSYQSRPHVGPTQPASNGHSDFSSLQSHPHTWIPSHLGTTQGDIYISPAVYNGHAHSYTQNIAYPGTVPYMQFPVQPDPRVGVYGWRPGSNMPPPHSNFTSSSSTIPGTIPMSPSGQQFQTMYSMTLSPPLDSQFYASSTGPLPTSFPMPHYGDGSRRDRTVVVVDSQAVHQGLSTANRSTTIPHSTRPFPSTQATHDPPSIPPPPPPDGSFGLTLKRPQVGQRIKPDWDLLFIEFSELAERPDPALKVYLNYILTSLWYRSESLEPRLGEEAAEMIIAKVRAKFPDDDRFKSTVSIQPNTAAGSRRVGGRSENETPSMYIIFANKDTGCQFSGCTFKADRNWRYVDHVRGHIAHRPYACSPPPGTTCKVCSTEDEPRRFFSEKLLKQHSERPNQREPCVECQLPILASSMRRHLRQIHKRDLGKAPNRVESETQSPTFGES